MDSIAAPVPAPVSSVGYPLLLAVLWLALSVLGWLTFMTWQLWNERAQLAAARQNQEANMLTASKIRTSLDAVATSTARLADSGNASARLIVEELRRNGITINQPTATSVGK